MSDMILGSRWQETELEYAVKGTSARLIEAEAAIARVREEVGTWPVALDKTVAACADSVLRALDGGAE